MQSVYLISKWVVQLGLTLVMVHLIEQDAARRKLCEICVFLNRKKYTLNRRLCKGSSQARDADGPDVLFEKKEYRYSYVGGYLGLTHNG